MPTTEKLRQSDAVAGELGSGVPTIDAGLLRDDSADATKAAVRAIRDACMNTGFFYVTNVFSSGADKALLARMRHFFALPDDDARKRAVQNDDAGDLGWTPVGGESAYQPGTIAHVESYDIERLGDGRNLWPDIDGFRDDVEAYWREVGELGLRILTRIAAAVGIDAAYFADRCRSEKLNTLRLLHYPQSDVPADNINVGISAHTDFECLSLLYQTSPGLELTDVNGNWYDTPAADGGLFVFIDDMLEFWTNGHLTATGHRVRHTPEQRFSIVLFMAVDDGITIEPLPEFTGEGNAPRYAPVTQAAHIEAEMERSRANTVT